MPGRHLKVIDPRHGALARKSRFPAGAGHAPLWPRIRTRAGLGIRTIADPLRKLVRFFMFARTTQFLDFAHHASTWVCSRIGFIGTLLGPLGNGLTLGLDRRLGTQLFSWLRGKGHGTCNAGSEENCEKADSVLIGGFHGFTEVFHRRENPAAAIMLLQFSLFPLKSLRFTNTQPVTMGNLRITIGRSPPLPNPHVFHFLLSGLNARPDTPVFPALEFIQSCQQLRQHIINLTCNQAASRIQHQTGIPIDTENPPSNKTSGDKYGPGHAEVFRSTLPQRAINKHPFR